MAPTTQGPAWWSKPVFVPGNRLSLPLPAKLFASYLLVVLVGALPTYFYLKQLFINEFMNDAVHRVASHAQLLANFINERSDARARISELQHLAPTLTERITYIGSNGRTLFDSSIANLHPVENQLIKPEVARALGELPADDSLGAPLPHTGISRRYSETGKIETLYVAVRLVNDAGVGSDCLRLAIPIAELESLSYVLVRVFRNSQAAAVSSALFLSVLAAVSFMRPLQRLSQAAKSMAAGDYTVQVASDGGDEISEVGHSLNLLGQQLRRRLGARAHPPHGPALPCFFG
jgi:HAMP domain-containing protein